jgi:hypothetical protein
MTGQIAESTLAKLHAKFVVPVAVERMLRGEEPLDDVAEYALNDIIGELQPDTALLCLALCAQHVATRLSYLPIARTLLMQAETIIGEYGPVWLANEAGSTLPNEKSLRALLSHIPEDLEALGDLLGATLGELDDDSTSVAAILCDILSGQAAAHKETAEAELDQIMASAPLRPSAGGAKKPVRAEKAANLGDNVILFPGARP